MFYLQKTDIQSVEITVAREAINYVSWLRGNPESFKFIESRDEIEEVKGVPIGTIEFVEQFLGKPMRPLNIPESLFKYAGRKIWNEQIITETFYKNTYVKSNDKIKHHSNGFNRIVNSGNWQFSEIVDIRSEWRVFVLRGKIIDIRQYSGELGSFYNLETIESIVKDYKDSPIVYSFDVIVNDKGTFILEVHLFMSVGLYGCDFHEELLTMWTTAFYDELNKNYNLT